MRRSSPPQRRRRHDGCPVVSYLQHSTTSQQMMRRPFRSIDNLDCFCGPAVFVAVRLMRHGQGLLGGISLLALAGAAWGQRAVGPGVVGPARPGFKPEYVAVTMPTAGFGYWRLACSGGLGARASDGEADVLSRVALVNNLRADIRLVPRVRDSSNPGVDLPDVRLPGW